MLTKIKNKLTICVTNVLALLASSKVVYAEGNDVDGSSYFEGVLDTKSTSVTDAGNTVNSTLKQVLNFARGAGIVVCVIMLSWCAIQLAMSAGNQQKRQLAMEGIKNVLIAVAIIGSATLICGIAYGILGN